MKKIIPFIMLIFIPLIIQAQNYQLILHLNDGSMVMFSINQIKNMTFEGVTDIESVRRLQQITKTFQVLQNYPNPFNPTTTITYRLPEKGKVDIFIYNIMGQRIRSLYSGIQEAGEHKIVWNGRNDQGQKVTSGLYIYQVIFKNKRMAKKMMLVK